jgi:[CysO sulfur-carrier protein]-S-L-cysteine hydrolase
VSHAGFPPTLVDAIRHCEAVAPVEGVGAYVAVETGWRFVPLTNVLGSSVGFEVDPLEWMRLEQASEGRRLCVVHAHPDGTPTLSTKDEAAFTVDGRPLLQDLTLVVLALRHGRVQTARGFAFEGMWVCVERFDTLSLQSHSDMH